MTPPTRASRASPGATRRAPCAHRGRAMTHYHQLRDPPAVGPSCSPPAPRRPARPPRCWPQPPRKSEPLIAALGAYYADADHVAPAVRGLRYSDAMATVAGDYRGDDEVQVFYALSLIATASPADRHACAARACGGHPGADLATPAPASRRAARRRSMPTTALNCCARPRAAARAYAGTSRPRQPTTPCNMPSAHLRTRLGLWTTSIASPTSPLAPPPMPRASNRRGTACHADYLASRRTYAYLQQGRSLADAAGVVASLHAMSALAAGGFKIGYAGNAGCRCGWRWRVGPGGSVAAHPPLPDRRPRSPRSPPGLPAAWGHCAALAQRRRPKAISVSCKLAATPCAPRATRTGRRKRMSC